MANRILPGYVTPLADKYELIIDHDGPASYSNIGTNAGTGDVMLNTDLGIGGFEAINVDGVSSDGLNYVYAFYIGGGGGNAVPSVALRWFVVATNAEVANGVNLSTKSIRLQIRGV